MSSTKTTQFYFYLFYGVYGFSVLCKLLHVLGTCSATATECRQQQNSSGYCLSLASWEFVKPVKISGVVSAILWQSWYTAKGWSRQAFLKRGLCRVMLGLWSVVPRSLFCLNGVRVPRLYPCGTWLKGMTGTIWIFFHTCTWVYPAASCNCCLLANNEVYFSHRKHNTEGNSFECCSLDNYRFLTCFWNEKKQYQLRMLKLENKQKKQHKNKKAQKQTNKHHKTTTSCSYSRSD